MCIFDNSKPTVEEGLLTLEQFKLPLPAEDLGGDVIIGWRSWYYSDPGRLQSPHYFSYWPHQKAMNAGGTVSNATGRGLYVLDNLAHLTRRHDVFGRVALFGRVLNFDRPSGAMGQYGYPLDLYTSTAAGPAKVGGLMKTFGEMGVNIWSSKGLYDPIEKFQLVK